MSRGQLKDTVGALAPWSAIAACGVLAVSDVGVSLVTPGYNASRETSSQLMAADVRLNGIARTGLFAYAVLLVPLALYLSSITRGKRPWSVAIVAGMWAHILFAAIAAALQNDSPDILFGDFTVDRGHDLSAKLMFAVAIAVVFAAAVASGPPSSSRVALISYVAAAAMLVTGLAFVLNVKTDLNGIYERVAAATLMGWAVFISFGRRDDSLQASAPLDPDAGSTIS